MKSYCSPDIATYSFPNLTDSEKKQLADFEFEPVCSLAKSLERKIRRIQRTGLKVTVSDEDGNSLELEMRKKDKPWKLFGRIVQNKEEAEALHEAISHYMCKIKL